MNCNRYCCFAVVAGGALVLASCASPTKIIRRTSAPVRPAWVDRPMHDAGRVFFVGICSGAETLEVGQDAAARDAAAKIAQYIGSEIRAESSDFLSEMEQNIVRQITSRSAAQLSEFRPEDLYYETITRVDKHFTLDKFDVYVLASYSRQAAQKERERQEKEAGDKALNAMRRYRAVGKAIGARNYWAAIRNCRWILRQTENLNGGVQTGDAVIGSVSVLRELTQEKLAEAIAGWHRFKLAINFKDAAPDTEAAFRSALLSVLSEKGFYFEDAVPSLAVAGEVEVRRGADILGSCVYSTEGTISFIRVSDRKTIATVAVQGKGLHEAPSQAAINAASEAGRSSGEELALALERFEGQGAKKER